MTLAASQIILEYVCPLLGTITANQMWIAPFKDVQKAIRRGYLGDLNPLPWAFMLGNCTGWVTYGILTRNFFVYFANLPGIFLAAWFNLAASKLQFQQQFARLSTDENNDIEEAQSTTTSESPKLEQQVQENASVNLPASKEQPAPPSTPTIPIDPVYHAPRHDYWVMFMMAFWVAVCSTITFGQTLSHDTKQLIVGIVVNLNLVFFYGAPLSTIFTVLRTRNAASIHIMTMLTNTANGVFWTCYGFAVVDYFIFVPNGLGAILGGIQMVLCVIFPRIENIVGGNTSMDDNPNAVEIAAGAKEEEVLTSKDETNQAIKAGSTVALEVSENPMSLAVTTPTPTPFPMVNQTIEELENADR